MVILRAYFDDAGTHDRSDVTALGGLIGSAEQWDKFESAWAAKLSEPLPDYRKPPLRKFGLSDCVRRRPGSGFEFYSEVESEAVRHDFRRIILDANLTGVSVVIDKRAWDDLITGQLRNVLGDAVSACFNQCLSEIVRFANPYPHGHSLAVWFDQGIETPFLQYIGKLWTRPEYGPRIKSVNFARVEHVLPLQGADIVATENYWRAVDWLKLGDGALPGPHWSHYLTNMLHQGQILDRGGIEDEVRRRGPDGRVPE
jgi:hypothetical protein